MTNNTYLHITLLAVIGVLLGLTASLAPPNVTVYLKTAEILVYAAVSTVCTRLASKERSEMRVVLTIMAILAWWVVAIEVLIFGGYL